jgi:CheY-like chemotaxis protein
MPALPASAATPDPAPPDRSDLLDGIQRDMLALIGQVASSIADDLRNPLATIVASIQAILASWPPAAADAGREAWPVPPELVASGVPPRQLHGDLERILAEANRASGIVHGLLSAARQNPPEWCVCSVADVVHRTLGLCRHYLKLHNITLQAPDFDPQEGWPLWSRVRGDTNQLQQVLLNLVINAQQAITVYRGDGLVRIRLAPDGPDRIVLTVEHDGPGVPDDLREAILPPFHTPTPAGKGPGHGLSVSASIVRTHGGEISMENRPQGGAVFRLVLPSLAASDRMAAGAPPGGPGHSVELPVLEPVEPGSTMHRLNHVLLVDDEIGIRRSVSRLLRRYGFQVTDVPDGQAALQALQDGGYDAVVSDLRMPGMSGEEFFRLVQQDFPAMARRVVFTSGDLHRIETQQFLAASGCPALQKPFELTELVRTLRVVCPAVAPEPDGRPTA